MRKLTHKEQEMVLQLAEDRLKELLEQRTSMVDPFVPYVLEDYAEEEQLIYQEANLLCEKLYANKQIDLVHYLGMENDYSIKNRQLVTFVQTTRHERVAMHIAYLMKQKAIEELKAMGYRPAQDYLAELFLPEYKKAIFTPKNETVIPPAEYVSYIFRALSKVEEHLKEGTSRKLSKDEIIMHDELWGAFMDCFTSKEVKVAKEMYAMLWKTSHLDMAQEMAFAEGEEEMNEEVMNRMRKDMLRVNMIIVKSLCNENYPDGRVNEEMSMSYLTAHAEDIIWHEFK